jgi:hypothetical protein
MLQEGFGFRNSGRSTGYALSTGAPVFTSFNITAFMWLLEPACIE